ncbi:MAG: PilZ domain-containing protein [Phycisphaerales bacterium]
MKSNTPIELTPSGERALQDSDGLVVRRHDRTVCRLEASVAIGERSRGMVRFSRSVGDGSGRVSAVIVDCSEGGVGLECDRYIPRSASVDVLVGCAGSGEEIALSGTVQRVKMLSRAPRYYLGVSVAGGGESADGPMRRLLGLAQSGGGSGTAEASRAGS